MSDFELRKRLGTQAKNDMCQYAPDRVWQQWDDLIKSIVSKKD